MNPSAPFNRRQFLKSGARYALLTGLASLAVAGEAKRRRLANDPHCVHLWTCADCAEFGKCAKPKARDFSRETETARATGANANSAVTRLV